MQYYQYAYYDVYNTSLFLILNQQYISFVLYYRYIIWRVETIVSLKNQFLEKSLIKSNTIKIYRT